MSRAVRFMLIISDSSVKPAATARKVSSPSAGLRARADQISGQYFKAMSPREIDCSVVDSCADHAGIIGVVISNGRLIRIARACRSRTHYGAADIDNLISRAVHCELGSSAANA